MRLTKRGKVVFSTLIAGVVVLSSVIFSSSDASARSAEEPESQSLITVLAGDTLWDIASDLDPKGDPRDLVFELMRLNKLVSAQLSPGQEIILPVK